MYNISQETLPQKKKIIMAPPNCKNVHEAPTISTQNIKNIVVRSVVIFSFFNLYQLEFKFHSKMSKSSAS